MSSVDSLSLDSFLPLLSQDVKQEPNESEVDLQKQQDCESTVSERRKEEGKYISWECGIVFPHKKYLKSYAVVHSGERKYFWKLECKVCGKIFKQYTALSSHVERKYKCDQCGKRYHFLRSLRHHKKTHDDSQSFECLDCRYIYALKISWYTHFRSKHKEENVKSQQFQCTKCLKSITSKCTDKIKLDKERTICLDCYELPKKVNPLPPPPATPTLLLLGYQLQNGNLVPCFAVVNTAANTKPSEGTNIVKTTEGSSITIPTEGASIAVPIGGASIAVPSEGTSIAVPFGGASVITPIGEASITAPIEGCVTGISNPTEESKILSTVETANIKQDIRDISWEEVPLKQEVEEDFNMEQVSIEDSDILDVKQEIKQEING